MGGPHQAWGTGLSEGQGGERKAWGDPRRRLTGREGCQQPQSSGQSRKHEQGGWSGLGALEKWKQLENVL